MSDFVHLHNHSHYSLLDGLAKINELVAQTKKLGMNAIALTDHGNLYGSIEFYKEAKKQGIKPIMGVEAYLAPKSRFIKTASESDKYFHITLLAKNNIGWHNLIQLVTKANLEGFYYKPRIDKELLEQYKEGLIVLSGCPSGEIPRMILRNQIDEAYKLADEYKKMLGDDFYIEIWSQPKIKEVHKALPYLIALAKEKNIPLVATQDTHYIKKEDAFYHDVLLAVQTGNKITDDDRFTLKAGEFYLRPKEEMEEIFKDVPEALSNTVKIAEKCNVEIQLGQTLIPKFAVPENETAFSYLKKLVSQRISNRYPDLNQEVKDRLEYELGVIEKTGFADYFLIVQDFVNWAKDRKIVVGPGRGSAAGSIVSYILRITEVDPIKYNLLFERFLNPDRVEMPDIDIDFTDIRRDEVMGYLREKYGENNVAHIITFGTMASRAAIRDSGRALGFSYSVCDEISKMIPFNADLKDALAQVPELKAQYDNNQEIHRLIDTAMHLEGVARHASVHACGTVIGAKPLTEYMPLQFAPQDPNTIITQFEMGAVNDMGLLKMDLLGLKNLTIIEETIRLIKDTQGVELDIGKIPLDDEKTFATLQAADTTGVFQLESSGMRRYLKELKPTELEDIIAMVALYRPGPMELIPQYIARKHGKEKATYLHPLLEPILGNTYGIGIYQEQMMRIARDLGGFTLGEADILRKAIGKKIKELLDKQQVKIMAGMLAKGIDKKTATAIWDLFPPFSRYGFNRSHAACYAIIAYQTAYLKSHFPVELWTALLNSDAGDVDRTALLVSEAKKMGIRVYPPDINQSVSIFSPEGNHIRFGLSAIKNVGTNIVEAIISERQKNGPYKSLADVLARVTHKDLNKKSLDSMAKAGVFDSLETERNTILGNLDKILVFSQQIKRQSIIPQNGLFGSGAHNYTISLNRVAPASEDDKLSWEKELLGFYVSEHPLKKYDKFFKDKKVTSIKSVIDRTAVASIGGSYRIAGVITAVKKIITKTKKPIAFAKIEDLSDTLEVVVFSEILAKKPELWEKQNIVIIQGKLSLRDNEPKIIVDEAIKIN
jgi:DNA polymerase-3 subunit alpha